MKLTYNGIKTWIYVLLLALFVMPKPAYAYLDPGTGSYLYQLAIAGLLTSTFFIRSIVRKAKEMVRSVLRIKDKSANGKNS